MAQCSLGGVWWARIRWPSYSKTLVAILACLATWGLLLTLLDESRQEAMRAAGWAASFALQAVLTALMATLIELGVNYKAAVPSGRFSLLFLFLWTTVVALLLGGGRWLSAWLGWTQENFFAWNYFRQLQALAIANSFLAVAVDLSLRLSAFWVARAAAYVFTLLISTAGIAVGMYALFGNDIGLPLVELIWLIGVEGLFLAATLVPLALARDSTSGASALEADKSSE
jgi:hypothetical protein